MRPVEYMRTSLIKIGIIIDNLDKYDDYVDDTHSHGMWLECHEEALDEILKIIERSNDDMSEEIDAAFIEFGIDTTIKPSDELLVAAVMMCKFMAHNNLVMREAGIPGTLMEECYKAIRST
jgi:hypothetical protein